jgi:predicted NBD/HSP70 family sugar kinase
VAPPGVTTSAGHVLEMVRSGLVRTRREVQEATGLSRSTVFLRLAELSAAGLVREAGSRPGAAGRPSGLLSFVEDDKLVLTADLGATHGRLALQDAGGAVLGEATEEVPIDSGPEQVLRVVTEGFRALLRDSGRPVHQLEGIGVGVPGPVQASGRPNQPPIMPGWHHYPVVEVLRRSFGVPVLVDNDANLMGLGEARTRFPDVDSLLFVKVGTGIGAGVILHGHAERGVSGGAGAIGHVRITHADADRRCRCGAAGCLAAYASGWALARQLTERGLTAASSRDVVRLVHQGHPEAIALVRVAGRLVGEVLATAVAVLNPGVLVLSGDMADTHEHFLVGVREVLYERTVPLATRELLVTSSALGDRAGVIGARHLVVDHVFSAAAVDERLRRDAQLRSTRTAASPAAAAQA